MKYAPLMIGIVSVLFLQCMTTSLPQVVIPDRLGTANFTLGVGTNGGHFNAMYATKFGMGILGSFGANGHVDHGEISLAFIQPGSLLVSLGVGNANFKTTTPLTYGGTRGIYDYWGYFSSLSVRTNIQVLKTVGFMNSLLYVFGSENGNCPLICNRYNTHRFSGMLMESAFYIRGRKNKHGYFIVSGTKIIGGLKPEPPDERFFSFFPIHIGIGYNFP